RYACWAASRSWTAASSVRTESTASTCWLSARARWTLSASTWSSTRRTSPFSAQPAVSPRASTNGRACFTRRAGSRLFQVLAAGENLELVSAILRPRLLVVSGGERPLLAVGHGLDAARIDAVADDVLLGRRRAPRLPPRRDRSAGAGIGVSSVEVLSNFKGSTMRSPATAETRPAGARRSSAAAGGCGRFPHR